MEGLLLQGESKKDMKMLNELARKIGLKTRAINNEEMEELGLINAMKKGRTGVYVSTDNYLKKIKS